MRKVRWGVLSTAKIGVEKVIPALQMGHFSQVCAIASRQEGSARAAARRLEIANAYGSYEELLADPEVEVIYNPLPNHLHLTWTLKALQAGKHVLCEKPLGLDAGEVEKLIAAAAKFPFLKVMEAFMYRFHPQWQRAKRMVDAGEIGELRAVHTFFSYYNVNPQDIRNIAEIGGGALLDIGCYGISLARFLFGSQPLRVLGQMEYDPQFKTDRMTSGLMDFQRGVASFICSTQMAPYQRVNILGDQGRIEIEIPFNAPSDHPTRIWFQREARVEEIFFEACDQYTLQGDAFSQAVLEDAHVPTPLSDALHNMRVIDAIKESAGSNAWVSLASQPDQ